MGQNLNGLPRKPKNKGRSSGSTSRALVRNVESAGDRNIPPPAVDFFSTHMRGAHATLSSALLLSFFHCTRSSPSLPSGSRERGQSDISPTMYMDPTTMLSRSLSSTNFSPSSAFSFLRRWAQALLHSFLFPLPPAALFSFLW